MVKIKHIDLRSSNRAFIMHLDLCLENPLKIGRRGISLFIDLLITIKGSGTILLSKTPWRRDLREKTTRMSKTLDWKLLNLKTSKDWWLEHSKQWMIEPTITDSSYIHNLLNTKKKHVTINTDVMTPLLWKQSVPTNKMAATTLFESAEQVQNHLLEIKAQNHCELTRLLYLICIGRSLIRSDTPTSTLKVAPSWLEKVEKPPQRRIRRRCSLEIAICEAMNDW